MKLIIYTDQEKYRMHCEEYIAIWKSEGRKIERLLRQNKFEPFTSQEILDRFEDFGE